MSINLKTVNEVIRIATDGTEAIDVVASYADWVSGTPFVPDSKLTLITTATTTTIVAAPGASTVRMVKSITITNTSATSANVIVNLYDGSNDHEMGTFDIGQDESIVYDGQSWSVKGNFAMQDYPCNGRLTLTTATPVTTADVTAATNWYFTPYQGNKIALYDTDSGKWKVYSFSELTLAVVASTNTNYDIYVYDNAGTLTLEAVAWTNDTTRATALALQDGIYCKNGSLDRRYLGTVRTTGTSGQCEDSTSSRFVWNLYNRVERHLKATDPADSWTYSTATWRASDNNTTVGVARVAIVIGLSLDIVHAESQSIVAHDSSNQWAAAGIGIDSTSVNSALVYVGISSNVTQSLPRAKYMGYPGIGYHYLQWLEIAAATGTSTWRGDAGASYIQTGLLARVRG